MKRYRLGITRKDRKTIETIRQKRQVVDIVERIKSVMYHFVRHLATRNGNRQHTNVVPQGRPDQKGDQTGDVSMTLCINM